jgi:hypothetical protein
MPTSVHDLPIRERVRIKNVQSLSETIMLLQHAFLSTFAAPTGKEFAHAG